MKLHEWTALGRGRAHRLARSLKITPPVVSDWCTGKKQIPIEQCVPIERFTNQEVTCEELRPDKVADFAYLRGLSDVEASRSEPAPPPAPGWALGERHDPTRAVCELPDLDRRESFLGQGV